MTELEKMKRAKMYIGKMANGVNPLTGEDIKEDDFINNVRISRCLSYVSGVLEKVIANGGEVTAGSKINPIESFAVELLSQFRYREDKSVSKVIAQLYEPLQNQNIKKISGTSINNWLVSCGFLVDRFDSRINKNARFPTDKGLQIGLRTEYSSSLKNGNEYLAIIYNKTAQEFLINNFEKFLKGEAID